MPKQPVKKSASAVSLKASGSTMSASVSHGFDSSPSASIISLAAITEQPRKKSPARPPLPPIKWMARPKRVKNCPIGLDYLYTIDQLVIYQDSSLHEVLVNLQKEVIYHIKSAYGETVYFGLEESEFWSRHICGALRPFDMKLIDNTGWEIMHFYRPLRCGTACFPCFTQQVEVTAPVGQVIGYVTQEGNCKAFTLRIENAKREVEYVVKGGCCVCDRVFKVLLPNKKTEIGKIQKASKDFARAFLTLEDMDVLTFPRDIDVRMKSTLLAACFLLDFMYF